MAMTGGISKLLKTTHPFSDSSKAVKLYAYYKTSTNYSTKKSTITCGMYVTTPSKWDIGHWNDFNGSYIGNTSLTFDGTIPNFSGTRWLVENKTFTVDHDSNGKATAKIYWKWGVYSPWGGFTNPSGSFSVSLPTIVTACSAPTTFTASSNNFDTSVTLNWSGASGGINNSIKYYYIQYATSSDNSTWGSWTGLKSIASSSTSGNYTEDMSSKVSRGHYVKFRIRTEGSAGSSYYSGYKELSSIRRKPYTKCVAPTTFTISSNNFNTTIDISWSGASGGTNNTISSYLIQYTLSSDNSNWGNWTTLQAVNTTKTSHSFSKDVSSIVSRGKYIKLRIRTQGSAGSSYYSEYTGSNSIKRNLYSNCTAPTEIELESEEDLTGSVYEDTFNSSITIGWSGAKGGDNNAVGKYQIEYQTSSSTTFGSTWTILGTTTSNSYTYIGTGITRGFNVRFRVKTIGVISGYDSDYIVSERMQRNSIPDAISKVETNISSLEFSNGDDITLKWTRPNDKDGDYNIYQYEVVVKSSLISTPEVVTVIKRGSSTVVDYTYIIANASDYVENNGQIQFGVRAIDVFGECQNDYTWTDIITRYDITGVAIGINGKWVNCQLYYAEYKWENGSIQLGKEIDSNNGIRSSFIPTNKKITITKNSEYSSSVTCHIFYYDRQFRYSEIMSTSGLSNTELTVETNTTNKYYARIVLQSSSVSQSELDKTAIVKFNQVVTPAGWIEQSVSAGLNGKWIESDTGI